MSTHVNDRKSIKPPKETSKSVPAGKIHPFPSREPRDRNKEIAANNRDAAAGVNPGDWGEKSMH